MAKQGAWITGTCSRVLRAASHDPLATSRVFAPSRAGGRPVRKEEGERRRRRRCLAATIARYTLGWIHPPTPDAFVTTSTSLKH